MIKRLLAGTFTYFLILGVIGVALATYFSVNITYIEYHSDYGIGMYTYNYYAWLEGIKNSLNSILDVEILHLPTWPTSNMGFGASLVNNLISIANVLIYITNWIISPLNIILASIKIVLYVLLVVMSIFGINAEGIQLYDALYTLYQLEIPQIPYIPLQ